MTSSLPASPVHTLYYYNPLILNTTSLHLVAQDDFILLLMLLLAGFIPHRTALSVYQDSAQITSPWSLTQCHWYLSPPPPVCCYKVSALPLYLHNVLYLSLCHNLHYWNHLFNYYSYLLNPYYYIRHYAKHFLLISFTL